MLKQINKRKEKIEALNQTEATIYQMEKTLADAGDKVDANAKSEVGSRNELN
ncbi:hypothetical protein Q5M85_08070 [Paraclostridium bifermentans]|nr:hypothetical protein [Paraclostridium bifermentans]